MIYRYVLAFGSNLEPRQINLHKALSGLEAHGTVTKASSWVETAPLVSEVYDTRGQGAYINFACVFESATAPEAVYEHIVRIEDAIGHNRTQKWAPREADIDILFCEIASGPEFGTGRPVCLGPLRNGLVVPHQDFWNRPFLVNLVVNELGIARSVLSVHLPWEKK